jgi:hypothetical protein
MNNFAIISPDLTNTVLERKSLRFDILAYDYLVDFLEHEK